MAAGELEIGDKVYRLDGSTAVVTDSELERLDEPIKVYNLEVEDYHTYFVGDVPVLVHNYESESDTLNNWLKDEPDLLKEVTEMYKKYPEWWGIDPENTPVFFRDKASVDMIRRKKGESGGHHPHGLALGGPEGQTLTITNETRKNKNTTHSKVTGLQKRVRTCSHRKNMI